ncbi:MAG: haloacid dehalogenase [Desulfurococcus sp.]|jgi:translin|uniref:haloacid dehalogenase n=1 Tax=Desulfurococcus sp. TaxID=51678 RepID=UPI00316A09A1
MEDIEKILNVIRDSINEIDGILGRKDSIREEVYRLIRELTRNSSDVVTLVHRGLIGDAEKRLSIAEDIVKKINGLLKEHPDIYYSGMVYNGLSEYVEAVLFYEVIVKNNASSWRRLDVPYVPYLQGLGDLIGELRRYIIKLLDKGLIEEAVKYFNLMEEIYISLRKLDYPDALTPGLRHKVDVASRLVEDTRMLILNTKNAYICAPGKLEA